MTIPRHPTNPRYPTQRPNYPSPPPSSKMPDGIPSTHSGRAPNFHGIPSTRHNNQPLEKEQRATTLPNSNMQQSFPINLNSNEDKGTKRPNTAIFTNISDHQDSKRACLECTARPTEPEDIQNVPTTASTTLKAMDSLTDLPNELLTILYSYLQNAVDVVHLSMTCKPLRALLSPRIMADTFIRNKTVWSIDFGLSQQYRLRRLSLGVWSRYMADGHQLALKLRGPPLEEVADDDEDVVMTEPVNLQVNLTETEQRLSKSSGRWRYDVCAPTNLVINPLFGKLLQQCPVFSPTLDEVAQWMNTGPMVSHTDSKSGKTLVCYAQKSDSGVRIMVCNQTNCSEALASVPEMFWRPALEPLPATNNIHQPPVHLSQMMQIMSMKFYPQQRLQGKMRVLIAIAFGRGSYNPPPNAGMAAVNNNGTQDTALLDILEVVKVIEIYIADAPRIAGAALEPPMPGRTEIIVLNSHQDALRGRIVEIYNAPVASAPDSAAQSEPIMEDRIALIGLRQYSDRGNANVILMKCQLFLNSPGAAPGTTSRAQSKWVCHVLATHGLAGMEATCMTLFPSRSPLERLVAILDRTGRGEIWDYRNVRRVAMLSLADIQATVSDTVTPATAAPAATATPRPVHPLLIPRKCSDGTPYTPLQLLSQTHHHLQQRKNKRQGLHYWGIHASFSMEMLTHGDDEAPDLNHGDIRLVAMADGRDKQSEVSWWHIDQERMSNHLKAIQDIQDLAVTNSLVASTTSPTSTTTTTATATTRSGNIRRIPPLEIRSSGRHFEHQTLSRTITFRPKDGQSFRGEIGKTVEPLQTNAFLVWENFRIMLSTENGLSIVDMDQEAIGDILPPLKMTSAKEKELQNSDSTATVTVSVTANSRRGPHVLEEDTLPTVWVTLLDNAEKDPITDISTVDDYLLVTRKYSHLSWPFRELVSKFLIPSPSLPSSTSHQVIDNDNKIFMETC